MIPLYDDPQVKKYLKLLDTTIETSTLILDQNWGDDFDVNIVTETKTKTEELLLIQAEKKTFNLDKLQDMLSKAVDNSSNSDFPAATNSDRDGAIDLLDSYVKERFLKIEREVLRKMKEYISKLEKVWSEQKDSIEYIGLKEIKHEFDQGFIKLKHLINEWDKRKYSDVLTDYLIDTLDNMWDEYDAKYQKMADIKRTEDVQKRLKEKELQNYKHEKRRPIPSWPNSVPYSKFKPDLQSWDKETICHLEHLNLVKWLRC